MNYLGLGNNEMDDEAKEREELVLNIVIMAVSMILIALVTIAVVANLDGSKHGAGTMKTLLEVCKETEHPESCFRVLKPVGERATILDFVGGAINATLRELVVVNTPKPQLEKTLTPLQAQSYRDCLELLNLAKEELESLYMTATTFADFPKINVDDIVNSLSAIISYQQTCSNELMRTNSYQILGYSMKIPILLARITLAIVNNFSDQNSINRGLATASQHDVEIPVTPISGRQQHKLMEVRRIGGGRGQQPNAVVAKDGSGQFRTIGESFSACPKNNKGQCVIYVKKGKYEERVVIPKGVEQVLMYGDGPMNTIVTGINITRDPKMVTTSYRAATFVVMGKGFLGKDMGFSAPAGITGAPALLVLADHAAFLNCIIDGDEGTLYAVAQRQFYRDCEIHGSVNIVRGDSSTVIQNSKIIVKPRNNNSSDNLNLRKNVVSAQSRIDKFQGTGLVIQNCTIRAQGEGNNTHLAASTYLGTPCSEQSRTIIMESYLGDVIHPQGWCQWSDNYGIGTATFREYNNRGPGVKIDNRVSWESYKDISNRNKMEGFTAKQFIQADRWVRLAGIPYESGFVYL